MFRRTLVTALAVLGFATFGPTPNVYAADVTLYEVTENMKLKAFKKTGSRRQASSTLTGKAAAGTPLCPLPVPCVINAHGADDVSVSNGLGTFTGKWATVVQGDNNVDAPEYDILNGTFHGLMDFSPALLGGMPYGTVVGEMWANKTRYPFTGVFYLPFVVGDSGPLYLGPSGPVPVDPMTEFSIGFPAVKFEITFGATTAK